MSGQPFSAGDPLGSCFALCGATTSSSPALQALSHRRSPGCADPFLGQPRASPAPGPGTPESSSRRHKAALIC